MTFKPLDDDDEMVCDLYKFRCEECHSEESESHDNESFGIYSCYEEDFDEESSHCPHDDQQSCSDQSMTSQHSEHHTSGKRTQNEQESQDVPNKIESDLNVFAPEWRPTTSSLSQ